MIIEQKKYGKLEVYSDEPDIVEISQENRAVVVQVERESIPKLIEILQKQVPYKKRAIDWFQYSGFECDFDFATQTLNLKYTG